MNSTDAYIYIIIGLIGVAYPILLQVVARLDEKYNSDSIVEIFNKEWVYPAFKYFLIICVGFIIIWSLKLPPATGSDDLNTLLEHSANILIGVSATLLVTFFFLFVDKVLMYYTPTKLIPNLISRCEQSNYDQIYFKPLTDLLILFIKRQDSNYTKTLSDFFYKAFRQERNNQNNQEIVYPQYYYEFVYKVIEELGVLKDKRNYTLEHRTSGAIWLIGEEKNNKISSDTYSWMWQNILLAITYQKDDLILNHWQTCHQHFIYNLSYIDPDYYSEDGKRKMRNQEEFSKRKAERQKFLEFHYALGGLLVYKEKYDCLKRIFSYTTSYPPKYELLPLHMSEIFTFYSKIRDPYQRDYSWVSSTYPFPELSGINADFVIKKWIMSYMAVLFLRQYTIVPYLITMQPLAFPTVPELQGEITKWIEGMDFFKRLLDDHLKNEELLKTLGLNFITREWCRNNNKPYPTTFIDNFKEMLNNAYDSNSINMPISEEKVKKFEDSTAKIISNTIEKLNRLNNKSLTDQDNTDKWYINGERMRQDKDAFSENSEVDHTNYHSFLAAMASENIINGLSECFIFKKTNSFLLKKEDFFKAIDRLAIDENFIIINFGVNLEHLRAQLNISSLTIDKYKSIDIYSFENTQRVRDSFFILNKSDLPSISLKEIKKEVRDKYVLKNINKDLNLYTSVVDLNKTTQEVFNESKLEHSDDELRKSVLLCIIFQIELSWRKNMKMIHIEQYNKYFQRGIPSNLQDVNSFWE